ncbi:glycosyl transferase [Variovorax sp. JS1663]|nr:glycosyl transferase [Variovorax sp. JS1663]
MLKRLIQAYAQDARYRHSVIVLTTPGPVGAELRAQGVEVEALGLRGALDVLPKMFTLTRMIRKARPDIVQTWMYHADLLGGLAARLAGRQSIIWGIRTTEVAAGGARATAMVRWLCARLSRRVPCVTVCAAEASRRRHVALGYDRRRMVVVPNGFDLARLQATSAQAAAVRARAGLERDALVVGTVGRFHESKDPRNFVRAAGLLARAHPEARFLMVGRGCDDDNRTLRRWIDETGHGDRFRLLGQREDVPACLAALDVFCLPSRTEGFPNVVGEAMAMRRACVVTDAGDAAHLLGECGVVVPREDAAALAAGMARLLRMSAAERDALGARAHARIAAEFTMARTRDRFEAIYLDVLKSRH